MGNKRKTRKAKMFSVIVPLQTCPSIGLGHFRNLLQICKRHLCFANGEYVYHRQRQTDKWTGKHAEINSEFEAHEKCVYVLGSLNFSSGRRKGFDKRIKI